MKRPWRIFSADFMVKVAMEAINELKTFSELAHYYQIHPNKVCIWEE